MKALTFYFDFISPYAWLAFDALPRQLQGLTYQVRYQPVLFAALLKHHGQLGPAEMPGKREWTYRQVQWLAHTQGTPLQLPATHPFNPLVLLRLAVASDADGLPNRQVCEKIFRHVWCSGLDAADAGRAAALRDELAPARDPQSDAVRQDLHRHTAEALSQGVFGVPTVAVDDRLFWGLDALPMLSAYLRGDPWYQGGAWEAAAQCPPGVQRR